MAPPDDRTRIVAESMAAGAKVSEVARMRAIAPGLIFAWRREARAKEKELASPRLRSRFQSMLPRAASKHKIVCSGATLAPGGSYPSLRTAESPPARRAGPLGIFREGL